MKKYEYCLLDVDGGFFSGVDFPELTTRLNALGQQGWEVVSVADIAQATNRAQVLLVTLRREVS